MLFFLSAWMPLAAAADPPPAAPPVVETPDYPGAIWEPASPANFQRAHRPSPQQPIDRIVIHDIEGTAAEAVRWFQNPKARASAHYVVEGQTGRVYQLIKERDIAWHAGNRRTNARSVGIEHEGFAYRPGFYNPVEYEASARLVRAIALRCDIPRDRTHIIGHFEVPNAAHPGRFGGSNGHTDPGPYWDWDYFMALIRNDARKETDAVPQPVILHPGETSEAAFTLLNTGDDPWPADPKAEQNADLWGQGPVYLGAWASGAAWGPSSAFFGPGWVSPRFAASAAGGEVAPGASGRFVVPLHAPRDLLGPVTETFRLFKVPVAPRLPVPFGPPLSVSARVEPWDLQVPLPPTPPPGWASKTLPAGSQAFWCKAAPNPPGPVRWQITLPIGGAWDVYARSAPGASRTARAVYQVTGADTGAETQTVDQRKGGGAWRKLGRFRFGSPPDDDRLGVPGIRPGASVLSP
ncbi:MAG: N-acetylmuramoyl-L-alanine amidase, partial [Armatimonadota bacterium]|nr:N-acetylmuramoyl-L-alanine amidase [Armatimonadota bacterium]